MSEPDCIGYEKRLRVVRDPRAPQLTVFGLVVTCGGCESGHQEWTARALIWRVEACRRPRRLIAILLAISFLNKSLSSVSQSAYTAVVTLLGLRTSCTTAMYSEMSTLPMGYYAAEFVASMSHCPMKRR